MTSLIAARPGGLMRIVNILRRIPQAATDSNEALHKAEVVDP
jgi:hypothetical protein